MLYFRKNVCSFVILFEGRTGSSYLTEHLDSHPNIRAHMEILGPLKNDPPIAQLQRTRKTLMPPVIGRHGAVGFKTKLRILTDPDAFAELLKKLRVKIIYMQRRNKVKEALSEITSNILKQKIDNYNIYDESQRVGAIHVDLKDFDWTIRFREEMDGKLNSYVSNLQLPTLPVFYEDLLLDLKKELRRIFSFLSVPYKKTGSKMQKHTQDDLRQALSNYDEIKAYYTSTKYQNMFDEVLVR